MRALFATLLMGVAIAAPLSAQRCKGTDPPSPTAFFPESVANLGREFYDMRSGSVTNAYKPTDAAYEGPWAVVLIEPHSDPFLGGDADELARHYERTDTPSHLVADWPVALAQCSVGDEFTTLKGEYRVSVVIKESTDLDASAALADAFFRKILPLIPPGCGTLP
jgi:hypothetical protein